VSVSSRPEPSDQLAPFEKFYGLRTPPFSLTPDLRFAYQSRSHSRAVTQVTEALRRREGLVVITGAIGTGKTMLCRALLEEFHEARTFLSVILDPCLTVDDLLYQVLTDFGLISRAEGRRDANVSEATRHQLVSTLHQFLASLIPLNAHAVIMIDEAQHLDPTVLEQIRLLSNFETDEAKLLQIVLVGQPDLDDLLRRPDMAQLNQRVARRFELHGLSGHEVTDYIARRLSVASEVGGEGPGGQPTVALFTPAAIRAIETISSGIPRLVNIVCDRALETACERQARTIDSQDVIGAATKLKLPVPAALNTLKTLKALNVPMASAAMAAAALVLLAIAGVLWSARGRQTAGQPSTAQTATVPPPPPPSSVEPGTGAAAPATPAAGRGSTSAPAAGTSGAGMPPGAAAGSAPADASGGYRIAVAAFRTSKRAIDVASDIAAKGLPVSTRADATGEWYQVVVGPFASQEAAANAQRTLAREGFADTRISPSVSER
jgi:general secretion pathway protein A